MHWQANAIALALGALACVPTMTPMRTAPAPTPSEQRTFFISHDRAAVDVARSPLDASGAVAPTIFRDECSARARAFPATTASLAERTLEIARVLAAPPRAHCSCLEAAAGGESLTVNVRLLLPGAPGPSAADEVLLEGLNEQTRCIRDYLRSRSFPGGPGPLTVYVQLYTERSRDSAHLNAMLLQEHPEFDRCFEDRSLSEVDLSFTIGKRGRARNIRPLSGDASDAAVACLIERLSQIRFERCFGCVHQVTVRSP